jgi:hypothetical protein
VTNPYDPYNPRFTVFDWPVIQDDQITSLWEQSGVFDHVANRAVREVGSNEPLRLSRSAAEFSAAVLRRHPERVAM